MRQYRDCRSFIGMDHHHQEFNLVLNQWANLQVQFCWHESSNIRHCEVGRAEPRRNSSGGICHTVSFRQECCVICFASTGGTSRHMCWPSRTFAETFGRKNPTRVWIPWLGGSVTFPPCGIRGCGKQPCCERRTGWTCQALQHGGCLPSSQAVHWQWGHDSLGWLGSLEKQWGWSCSRRCPWDWGVSDPDVQVFIVHISRLSRDVHWGAAFMRKWRKQIWNASGSSYELVLLKYMCHYFTNVSTSPQRKITITTITIIIITIIIIIIKPVIILWKAQETGRARN